MASFSVKFEIEIQMRDTRRILIIKSHNSPISDTTSELVGKMAPSHLYKVVPAIEEVTVLIGTDTKKAPPKSPEERLQAAMEDWGNLERRVYNSLSWNIRRHPGLFTGEWRVLYCPHGNSTISAMVIAMLTGIFGQAPEIINQISHMGELVPVAGLPLIDLEKMRQSGRKLRDLGDQVLQDRESGGKPATFARGGNIGEETHHATT